MVFKGRFFSSKKSDSSSPDASSNSPRSFSSNSPSRSDKKKAKSAAHPILAAGGGGGSGGGGALAACRQTQVKDGTKKKDVVKGKEIQTLPSEARTEGLVEDPPLSRGWWTLRPKWILKRISGMKWVTNWVQMCVCVTTVDYGLGPNWPEAESYAYGTGWWLRPKGVPFGLTPICLGSRPEAKCGKQPGQKALTVLMS